MNPIEFVGWDGGDGGPPDRMTLGTLEGGSAPLLTIYGEDEDGKKQWQSFCFDSPQQVRDFIVSLTLFANSKEDS